MTNTQTIFGALTMVAMSCLMMLAALEPVVTGQPEAVPAQHGTI